MSKRTALKLTVLLGFSTCLCGCRLQQAFDNADPSLSELISTIFPGFPTNQPSWHTTPSTWPIPSGGGSSSDSNTTVVVTREVGTGAMGTPFHGSNAQSFLPPTVPSAVGFPF